MIAVSARARAELAPTGTIRAAINTANPATVFMADDGGLSGPSVDLALALGTLLALPVDLVRFASAGQIVAAEKEHNAWDIAFLAVDPARAERLHFSPPYLTIEAGYAVPANSAIGAVDQVDRAGVRIATSAGAAYDLYLARTLRAAERCPFADPAASFTAFDAGGYHAVAGVRQALSKQYEGRDDVRVLPGAMLRIDHAMVVPIARRAASETIDRFVRRAR